MLVWKHYKKSKSITVFTDHVKEYRILLLFGFIPLFVSITEYKESIKL